MNTVSSVYYGWVWLALCGGGSYYFARRAIKADRRERAMLEHERRATRERLIEQQQQRRQAAAAAGDGHPSASREAGMALDPSPGAGHKEPVSKYEASEPYVSVKGDRFSAFGREQRHRE